MPKSAAELCTILLEASQNGKITLINYLATGDVTSARCLLTFPPACWATAAVEQKISDEMMTEKILAIVFLRVATVANGIDTIALANWLASVKTASHSDPNVGYST